MLAGMMIETLAKAVLVERNQIVRISELKNHNLKELVVAAGYSPNPEEIVFLDRLSEFVRWAGRYPVPLKPTNLAVNDEQGRRQLVGGSLLGADVVLARTIADGLEGELQSGSRVRTGTRLPTARSSADPWRKQRCR
jgi:hypothetical protein